MIKVGVLKESGSEKRVILLPEGVRTLQEMKTAVWVEAGAGKEAYFQDRAYIEAGARIAEKGEIIENTSVIIKINPPTSEERNAMKEGTVLIAILQPLSNISLIDELAKKNITTFSLDCIPRTTRAQTMDVLSSMATVAGYKAVLLAASHLPTFFPMFITAAGTVTPAKVLILGAGVAGLQAIATARRLGAVVEVFDVRADVKEEVETLGAKFVEVEGAVDEARAGGYAVEQTGEFQQKQKQLIHNHAVKSDVIITAAQIPGKAAPKLISEETVDAMKPGSVIVDLAASSGGNCEVCKNNETIVKNGVTIIGESNLPATMPVDASKMLGKNIINFLKLIINKGELNLDFKDDIIKNTCITLNKEIINERVKNLFMKTAKTF